MVDSLQIDSEFKALEEKLQKREYQDCIASGNDLLVLLRSDQDGKSDSAKNRIDCLVVIGDSFCGLKQFQEALFHYDNARKLAEITFGPLTEESMKPLFRVERALKALSDLTGGSADNKNVLTSTFLLSSQTGETRRTSRHASTLHALQGLWSGTIEKQKSKNNPMKAIVDLIMQKLGSDRAEVFLSRLSIIVSLIGLAGLSIYAFIWWNTHPDPTAIHPVPHGDFRTVNQSHCKTKASKWSFKSIDNARILAWTQDGSADLSGSNLSPHNKLPVTIYSGDPGSLVSAIFAAATRNNLLLRWNGYELQDQYDTTYYDSFEPESAVVGRMYSLRNWAQDYFKSHKHFPSNGDHVRFSELNFTNPFSKHSERASLIDSSDDVKALPIECASQNIAVHPGAMVCATVGPQKFFIGSFDRGRNPIPTSKSYNGFLSVNPTQKSLTATPQSLNNTRGIIVFEKPINQLTYFITAHSLLTGMSIILVLGAVGPTLFLFSRKTKSAVRVVKPVQTRR